MDVRGSLQLGRDFVLVKTTKEGRPRLFGRLLRPATSTTLTMGTCDVVVM